MFKRTYRKMNKVEETGASGSNTGVNDSGNAANTESNAESEGKETDTIDYKALYEQTEAEKAKVLAKRDELLGKLKSSKEKISEFERNLADKELKEAQADGNTEKMLEITKRELEKIKNNYQDLESKETERKEKILMDAKKQAFLKELGAELYNPKDIKDARLDLLIPDENGVFDPDGLRQAVEDYRKDYHYRIKSVDQNPESTAARGAESKKDLTPGERMKLAQIEEDKGNLK